MSPQPPLASQFETTPAARTFASPVRRRTLLAACALLGGFFAGAHAGFAQEVTTVPVGALSINIPAGPSLTITGIPIKSSAVFIGAVDSLTSSTITFEGTPFEGSSLSNADAPFFALVTTGPQAGRYLFITGNTNSAVTVDLNDGTGTAVALNTSGASLAQGDLVEIIPGDTLASLLKTGSDTLIAGGTSLFAADTVGFWNGARQVAYFYHTTLGHWVESGSTVNQNNKVIRPDESITIARRSPRPATSITVIGNVPNHRLLVRHSGASTRLITQPFPHPITLSSLTGLASNTSLFNSDTVGIWNGARWIAYYKNSSSGKWLQQGDSQTDFSDLVIQPGQGLTILRRSAQSGINSYIELPRPYSDLTTLN